MLWSAKVGLTSLFCPFWCHFRRLRFIQKLFSVENNFFLLFVFSPEFFRCLQRFLAHKQYRYFHCFFSCFGFDRPELPFLLSFCFLTFVLRCLWLSVILAWRSALSLFSFCLRWSFYVQNCCVVVCMFAGPSLLFFCARFGLLPPCFSPLPLLPC